MSLAGFKKQFNKTSQFLSEKVGGKEGSQYEEEFIEIEKETDVFSDLVNGLLTRTTEVLQPNPATRAKLTLTGPSQPYPQPEAHLSEHFLKHASGLKSDSPLGQSLIESGNSFKQVAETKDNLDAKVKQDFLGPLHKIQNKDLKDISQSRKKLESNRLDYDYKKGKGAKVPEAELNEAKQKFDESREQSFHLMQQLMECDADHIKLLHAFAESELEYYKKSAEILQSLVEKLSVKMTEAANRPKEAKCDGGSKEPKED